MPHVATESQSSQETIGGLAFQKFSIKLDMSSEITMHILMYSRLFDNKEFTVNIMYVDQEQGNKMLKAWLDSKFE